MSVYIPGLRGTGDWGTDERPKSFRETILWLDPNGDSPLTALMGQATSESVDDPEYSWWEEENQQARLEVDGTITAGVTALVVFAVGLGASATTNTGGLSAVVGEQFMLEDVTGAVGATEIVRVTAVNSDTSLTIARGAAGTTAASLTAGAFLVSLGTAFEEGSNAADANFKNPTKYNNFCQIFKTSYEISETAKKTKARTGDPVKNDKRRKMFAHASKMEYAYMMGQASETTGAGGKPIRTTGGLLNFLSTNKTTFTGGGTAFTEDNFIDAVSPVFDVSGEGSSNTRVCLAGNMALTNLNKLARDSSSSRVNFDGIVDAYGMKLQRWILPQGELLIRTHPLFNRHPVFTKSMIGLNMKGVIDRTLRATKFEDGIQAPGADVEKGQWITESGLELHHEQTHFYLSNME